MLIPTKKLKNGFELPVYGIGTWQMGGRETYNPENDDRADINAIKAAIDEGVTHIDTAEIYAEGHAEKIVGEAIKGHDRQKLFIVSKVQFIHLSKYEDVIQAAKDSLKRIGTDYLDLYLLHRPSPNIRETMRAMDDLIKQGLIRNMGVCNLNIEEFDEAQACTKNKIVINQLHYNVKYREMEKRGLLSYCQKNDVMLVAWRPLQKGIILDEETNILTEMAEKYHKTPAQIAINWLISQDNVVTLSKTTSIGHLKENLGAVGWEMDLEDVERLRKEYPDQVFVSDAVPLH